MSKLRLAAGILAVVAMVAAGMTAVVIARNQERRDTQAPRAEYTVAAASNAAESATVVGPRIAVPMRRGGVGPFPETLTLVVVGGLLLGLAAAVRRTT